MRCCVPSCDNNSENISQTDGITFFRFPSDSHLRAAWLRALGRQDTPLPDPAVVCSQHFLSEDMYETESGSRQILTGAIPSTVQVCMICLDIDSKMFSMSKHKFEEAYDNLTGHPPCDLGNLRQTLCVYCAQSLRNFSRFREKSLTAQTLMLDLVQQHELITRQHIKIIRTKHKLSSHMVSKTLGPDHCDLHILEDEQTKTETTIYDVKIERSYDSIDENIEVKKEDDNADNISDGPLKYETTPFQCTLCCEEFFHEHAYMRHMSMHLQAAENGAASEVAASQVCNSPHVAVLAESKSTFQQLIEEPHTADLPHTLVAPPSSLTKSCIKRKLPSVKGNEANEKLIEIDIDFNYQAASGSEARATGEHQDSDNIDMDPLKYETTPFQCTLCYEEFVHEHAYMQHMSMHIQNGAGVENCASQVCKPHTAVNSSLHTVLLTGNKPAAQQLSDDSRPSEDLPQTLVAQLSSSFTSNHGYSPEASTSEEHVLHSVKKVHDESKPYSCQFCPFRCKYPSNFTTHMRTHTGEKPYACKLCNYKCVTNSALVNHMRTHTGEKPYSCKLCEFKSSYKGNLVGHMRTHTGEKPFSCKFCEYKSVSNSALVNHLRTHTGEKPYSCNFCEYKCVSNTALLKHLRTHTGEKRFSCEVCEYKCVSNSALMNHMRTHTGEKPFSCEVCDYKFAHKSHLVRHMKTHTGEKPYHCKFCEYRTAHRDNLVNHIRTHTGERPYSCELCEYKSSAKSKLVIHMRTHTGEKPFNCDLCDFRCSVKHNLVIHRRSHTGEK